MDRYASYAATDMMEAYYKVALKKVVDDISVLAIEALYGLNDDVIQRIAAESEESAAERARSTERLKILEMGFQALNSLKSHSRKTGFKESASTEGDMGSPLLETDPEELDITPPPDEEHSELWPAVEAEAPMPEKPCDLPPPSVEVNFALSGKLKYGKGRRRLKGTKATGALEPDWKYFQGYYRRQTGNPVGKEMSEDVRRVVQQHPI
ncbi:hypothetical protein PAAG_08638 [Paracoccidioides lutzii Pb01]|uniref:GED domain-containing protein n=1 Tax=Paracoccidioides lutzii (strain ATCC MYA-826 / Pb01) TaxID=502779 RepID=C1HCZ7_PARBA|nr:hypothetical protein PAAG_08638 [Paracoccidioides lutzii Pb01]EEH39369.2 hypothetical protein PAAG_08638 [Paracoccidioides lutzii Pb01]